MAGQAGPPGSEGESPIVVVSAVMREAETLEQEFARLLDALQATEREPVGAALDNMLLLDSAAEATQETAEKAVEGGKLLVKRCLELNRALRGSDMLAERVRQLKAQTAVLEGIVARLTPD